MEGEEGGAPIEVPSAEAPPPPSGGETPVVEEAAPAPLTTAEPVELPVEEKPAGTSGYEIFGQDPEKRPGWLNEYLKFQKETGKGFTVSREEIQQLPEVARRMIANLQGDYTKKTQAASEQRKSLEQTTEALADRERAIKFEEASLQKRLLGMQDSVKAGVEKLGTEPRDPFSEEGIAWSAKKAALEAMVEHFFTPMQESMKALEAEAVVTEAARFRENRRSEIVAFADANPDFRTMLPEIEATQKEFPNVPAERIYRMLKAEAPAAAPVDPRFATRQTSRRPVGPRSVQRADGPPPEVVAEGFGAIYNWHEQNQ